MEISADLFLHYVQIRRPEAVWSTLLEAEDLEVEKLGPLQRGPYSSHLASGGGAELSEDLASQPSEGEVSVSTGWWDRERKDLSRPPAKRPWEVLSSFPVLKQVHSVTREDNRAQVLRTQPSLEHTDPFPASLVEAAFRPLTIFQKRKQEIARGTNPSCVRRGREEGKCLAFSAKVWE